MKKRNRVSLVRRVVNHPVAQNVLGLYGVHIASYIIPLVTLPYLARVLRPQGFGLLLFAQSFALWASQIIEYGFNLSATREIAQNREKSGHLAATAAGVLGAKVMLSMGFAIVAVMAAWSIPNFREHPIYLLWALPVSLAFGFSPLWYFQGTERMVGAGVVDFLARAAGAIFIFLVVRTSEDGWKSLALQAAAGCASTLIQTLWMYQEIEFRRPRWKDSTHALRLGWHMFLFRGAYQIYSTANTFILGLFVPPVQVGYFGGAERISRPLQGAMNPAILALYPRMSQLVSRSTLKAARFARLTLSVAGGSGLALALALALLARWLVSLILGPGYEPSVSVLYVFALVLPINTMNIALIFYWMLPCGMERPVSAITLGAITINVISAALLAPRFAHVGMAWAILIAEACKFTGLVAILLRRNLTPVNVQREPKPQSVELL
jgi:PST family polysaccharide transporter